MRMMLRVVLPADKGSEALKSGKLKQVFQQTMATIKPEAAYFGTQDGKRTAIMVFDLTDQAMLPTIAEPLFSELHAAVDVHPVMTADDLMKGLAKIGL
jgi:hypothetical protein